MSPLAALVAEPLPLDRRRSWVLLTGAGDAPAVRHTVTALLMSSAAATLVWCMAWLHDVWLGRASPAAAAWAGLMAIAVWVPCWRLWRRWQRSALSLTLHWEGLPRAEARTAPPVPSHSECAAGRVGWWVSPWRCAAVLDVVLDLQRHVLIKLAPSEPVPHVQAVWLWVDLRALERRHRVDRRHASAHMLRTCMHVRLSQPKAQERPRSSVARRGISLPRLTVMASSQKGLSLPDPSGLDLPHQETPTLAALMSSHLHADFADTEVFVPEASAGADSRIPSHRELA